MNLFQRFYFKDEFMFNKIQLFIDLQFNFYQKATFLQIFHLKFFRSRKQDFR